jgi:hypothetical protein
MGINPLSTPLKTEYKPLGLEAFAQPLSEMQAKYDVVESQIDDANYTLSRLSKDDPRAKELIAEIEGKTNDLAQNLMATGNYKQAGKKLKDLNEAYAKSNEVNAIAGNKAAYTAALEEEKKRVGASSNGISQRDFDNWNYYTTNKFEGTKYDPETEQYTSINTRPVMENKEKEIMDYSLKMAGMAPEERITQLQNLGIDSQTLDLGTATIIKTSRDRDQVAGEISRMLHNSDQYKDWVDETSKLEFYRSNNTDPNFKDNVMQTAADKLNDKLTQYNELAKSKDPATAKVGTEGVSYIQGQLTTLSKGIEDAKKSNAYDDYAEQVYTADRKGLLDKISFNAADLVDFSSYGESVSYRETEQGRQQKANNKAADDKIKAIGTINYGISPVNTKGEQMRSGGSSSTSDVNDKFLKNNYSTLLKEMDLDLKLPISPGTEVYGALQDLGLFKVGTSPIDLVKEVAAMPEEKQRIITTYSNISTIENLNRKYDEDNKASEGKISALETRLSKATTPEDKAFIKAEIDKLATTKTATTLAKDDTNRILSNIISEEALKSTDPTVKALVKKYEKNPLGLLSELKKDMQSSNLKQLMADPYGFKGNIKLSPTQQLTNNIIGQFKSNLYFQNEPFAVGLIIPMNSSLDKFTDGAISSMKKTIGDNLKGGNHANQVTFDDLTGKSTKVSNPNYNFGAYMTDASTPPEGSYLGVDKNGVPIVSYSIKVDRTKDSEIRKFMVAHGWTDNPNDKTNKRLVTPADIQQWKKDNPANLVLAAEGYSYNPAKEAMDNYTQITERGLNLGGNEGAAIQKTVLENFAPLFLISDADRRERYHRASANMKDGVDNKEFKSMTEAPAAWKDNGNGTYTGYSITYTVNNPGQTKGQITATVLELVRDSKGNFSMESQTSPKIVAQIDLSGSGQNLPVAMLKLNMQYGSGSREDLITQKVGWGEETFVPAFKNINAVEQ